MKMETSSDDCRQCGFALHVFQIAEHREHFNLPYLAIAA